jgi:uncharacterized protein YecA (UPF0149 family)
VTEDEEKAIKALEKEQSRVALTGAFVSGKRRNLLVRPLGSGPRGTVRGGRECERNAPCPCGSKLKYKACCRKKGLRFVHTAMVKA